jgi:electron transfer flavoprotein alpha subunit
VYTDALCQIASSGQAELILIGSTRRGKELAPRVAQKWDAGCVTDAMNISVQDKKIAISRYTLGGNTVSVEVMNTPKQVISVLPQSFFSPLLISLSNVPLLLIFVSALTFSKNSLYPRP